MKTLKTSKHLRGWIPDFPDHRDFLYAAVRPVGVRLPKSVDLRPGMSAVENQGQLGSCTANALAGALEFLEIKSVLTQQLELILSVVDYGTPSREEPTRVAHCPDGAPPSDAHENRALPGIF